MEAPTIIKKHWIGYVAILGAGVGVASCLWLLIADFSETGEVDITGAWALYFASVVILAITIVQLWVYALSYIELTSEYIHVVNWRTLFVKQDVTAEWVRVQDASIATGSIFALLFHYAKLTVQTAGTEQDLSMTMTPRPEYWRDEIQTRANASTNPQA